MDDLVILKHAKSYIDQLAKGIDPISGKKVPADQVLTQERLLKCFAYVSTVLEGVVQEKEQKGNETTQYQPQAPQNIAEHQQATQHQQMSQHEQMPQHQQMPQHEQIPQHQQMQEHQQVPQNQQVPQQNQQVPQQNQQVQEHQQMPQLQQAPQDEQPPPEQVPPPNPEELSCEPLPFQITAEQQVKVPISDDPVKLSAFCETITQVVNHGNMLPLSEEKVVEWLESQGYLTSEEGAEPIKPVATEKGTEIGIETIGGLLPFSSKTVTTYHTKAQQFILEHIWDIYSS